MNTIKYRNALVRHTAKREAEIKAAETPAAPTLRSRTTPFFIVVMAIAALIVMTQAGAAIVAMAVQP